MHLGGRAGTTTKGQSLWLAASGEGEWEVTAERVKNLLLQKFLAKNKVYFKKKKKKRAGGFWTFLIPNSSNVRLTKRQAQARFLSSQHTCRAAADWPHFPPKLFM